MVNSNLVHTPITLDDMDGMKEQEIVDFLISKVIEEYEHKIKELPVEIINDFEKAVALRVIDTHWMDHINTMSHLREGIGLRGYAQENPLRAYTLEGFELFDELLNVIDRDTTLFLLKAEIRQNTERKQVAKGTAVTDKSKENNTPTKKAIKVGRNQMCPCGSGKKYKNCCGRNA